MKKPNLKDLGSDIVWLRGSQRTIRRTIYVDGGKTFIVWYGDLIEVRRSNGGMGYATVLDY